MENLTTESEENGTAETMDFDLVEQNQETKLGITLFSLVMISLILWIYIGNGLAIYLMVTNERFKNPGNYVKCAYAVNDVLMNTFANPFMLANLLLPAPGDVPRALCRLLSALAICFNFSTMYMTTLVAVERYFYFCRPFQYTRIFTVKSIVGISCVLTLIPLLWAVATDLDTPRQLSTAVLLCQLKDARAHIPLQVCLFLGPSILGIIFSTTMIRRLQTRAQSRVEPFPNTHPTVEAGSIKKGIRLIFLIAGAYWGTHIPSWIIRIQILSTGVTFEELDNRVDVTKSVLMRVHVLVVSMVASALNPIVYFALHRDLRVAAMRLFGGSQQFSWEKEMAAVANQSNTIRQSRDESIISHM